jgi:uncharacterized protein with GYD domain
LVRLALAVTVWTLGAYDIVLTVETPDDETAQAAVVALGSQGNVRTRTLRAFTSDEMRADSLSGRRRVV